MIRTRACFLTALLFSVGVVSANAKTKAKDYIYSALDTPLEILEEQATGQNLDSLFIYGIALAVGRAGEDRINDGFAIIRHTETMTVVTTGGLSLGAGNVRGVGGQVQPLFLRGVNIPAKNETHNYNGNRKGYKVRRQVLVCLGGLTHTDPKKREIKACGGLADFDELKNLMPKDN